MSITVAQAEAYVKERYNDDLTDLVPDADYLSKNIKFESSKKLGHLFHAPVVVRSEQGLTFNANNPGSSWGSAFAINQPRGLTLQDAQLTGAEIVLASNISYSQVATAGSSKESFGSFTDLIFGNMLKSAYDTLEIEMLYGQSGLGTCHDGYSATVQGVAGFTVQITPAQWAAGLWAGKEGATFDFFSNTPTMLNDGTNPVILAAVNSDTQTLYFQYAGTVSTITTAIMANPDTVQIYFQGAAYVTGGALSFNEMMGVNAILTATTKYMNIDPSVYSLWKSNQVNVNTSQPLNFANVNQAIARCVAKGLAEESVLLVNPNTWTDLADTSVINQRLFDSSYSARKTEVGTQSIMFHAQSGPLEIVPHIFVKAGDAFLLPKKQLMRVGAQDVEFKPQGMDEKRYFVMLEQNAGWQVRLYSNQALLLKTPARAAKISGFTNSIT